MMARHSAACAERGTHRVCRRNMVVSPRVEGIRLPPIRYDTSVQYLGTSLFPSNGSAIEKGITRNLHSGMRSAPISSVIARNRGEHHGPESGFGSARF